MSKELYLKPKMGIIPELSIQNYETFAQQLREVITNALDANAKNVIITLSRSKKGADLLIEDDGEGMGLSDFKNEFLALGGSKRYYDQAKIGRIGIGFLAAIPLCKLIEIHSRKQNSNEAFIARLECEKFTFPKLRMEQIKDIKIGEIISSTKEANKLDLPLHFTRIKLIDLSQKAIEVFNNDSKLELFIEELEKILPIEYATKPKLFNLFSNKLNDELVKLSESNKLNVYLNSDEKMCRRSFENIDHIEGIREVINKQIGKGMTITGYLIATNKVLPENWRGLNMRVLNVSVEHQSFMGLQGYEARKRYITGEIYIKGIDKNKAIAINRNKFNEDNDQVIHLAEYIRNLLIEYQKGINTRWIVKHALNKVLTKIKEINDTIRKTGKALEKIFAQPTVLKKAKPKSLALYQKGNLLDKRKLITGVNIDEEKKRINIIVDKDFTKIGRKKDYKISWKDSEGFKADIKINYHLLDAKQREIKIGQKSYKCIFVKGQQDDRPCEIDFRSNKIYFNLNHVIISTLEASNILFAFLLEYAYKNAKSKEGFYDLVIYMLEEYWKR